MQDELNVVVLFTQITVALLVLMLILIGFVLSQLYSIYDIVKDNRKEIRDNREEIRLNREEINEVHTKVNKFIYSGTI